MNWYYWKVVKLDIVEFWKNILRISIIVVVITILGNIIVKEFGIKNFWMLLIFVVIYAIICVIGSWILEINEYEKSLVKEMFRKIER